MGLSSPRIGTDVVASKATARFAAELKRVNKDGNAQVSSAEAKGLSKEFQPAFKKLFAGKSVAVKEAESTFEKALSSALKKADTRKTVRTFGRMSMEVAGKDGALFRTEGDKLPSHFRDSFNKEFRSVSMRWA